MGIGSLFAPFVNLTILIVLLFTKLRVPARDYVHGRHIKLRDELKAVRDQLALAQDRYNEFTAKLKTIEAESAVLRDQSKQDAAAAKQRVAAQAQRLSTQIVADAKATAGNLVTDLRTQLFAELAGKVLDRAEALMRERLTGDDRARIRREFSSEVESVPHAESVE